MMSHSTFMFLHTQSTEHNLSDACGHTGMDERKVNHISEQGQAGSICEQYQMSQTETHTVRTFSRLIKCKVRTLLWSVDMNHFERVHDGRESAQFACCEKHSLTPTVHTQSLTVLVTPVPVRSSNNFNALENPFEDDPWEILPRRQTHSVMRAWRNSWANCCTAHLWKWCWEMCNVVYVRTAVAKSINPNPNTWKICKYRSGLLPKAFFSWCP